VTGAHEHTDIDGHVLSLDDAVQNLAGAVEGILARLEALEAAPEPTPDPDPTPEPEPDPPAPEPPPTGDGGSGTDEPSTDPNDYGLSSLTNRPTLQVRDGSIGLKGANRDKVNVVGGSGTDADPWLVENMEFRGEVRVEDGVWEFDTCNFKGNSWYGIRTTASGRVKRISNSDFGEVKQASIACGSVDVYNVRCDANAGDFIKVSGDVTVERFYVRAAVGTDGKHKDCFQFDDGATGSLMARNGVSIGTTPDGSHLGNSLVQSKADGVDVVLDNVVAQAANYITNVQGTRSSTTVIGGTYAPSLDGSRSGWTANTPFRAQDGATLSVSPETKIVDRLNL